MTIIIDSGSTKAEVAILKHNKTSSFTIDGLNPFFLSNEELKNRVMHEIFPKTNENEITQIYFYGTGCGAIQEQNKIKKIFSETFKKACIEINTDLLAAARAIFQNQPGIICILGTGSNSGIYDDKIVTDNIRPLGYILGDEASGAWYGKKLVQDYFKNKMPELLMKQFQYDFQISRDELIKNLYSEKFPNRYLASFFPFINTNLKNEYIINLCDEGLSDFFELNIAPYQNKNLPIGFAGSVAFYLKEFILKTAVKKRLEIKKIVKSPMEGLIEFHKKN